MGIDPWVDRGTCPLLFELEGTPCVLSPTLLGVVLLVHSLSNCVVSDHL